MIFLKQLFFFFFQPKKNKNNITQPLQTCIGPTIRIGREILSWYQTLISDIFLGDQQIL